MMRYWMGGAVVFVLAGCATGPYDPFVSNVAAPSPSAEEAVAADKRTPEGVRCEFIREIGSRMPPREVCMTEAEWARIRENAQEIVREIERLPVPAR